MIADLTPSRARKGEAKTAKKIQSVNPFTMELNGEFEFDSLGRVHKEIKSQGKWAKLIRQALAEVECTRISASISESSPTSYEPLGLILAIMRGISRFQLFRFAVPTLTASVTPLWARQSRESSKTPGFREAS